MYRKKLPKMEAPFFYYAVKSRRFPNLSMISEPMRREASSPTADVNHVIKNGASATTYNSKAIVNIDAANKSEK